MKNSKESKNRTKENKLRFHNLEVWQLGMKLVHLIYKITKEFPKMTYKSYLSYISYVL